MAKAQKYCKYAGSALNFDDVKSAIDNLEKALHLLTTGREKWWGNRVRKESNRTTSINIHIYIV